MMITYLNEINTYLKSSFYYYLTKDILTTNMSFAYLWYRSYLPIPYGGEELEIMGI